MTFRGFIVSSASMPDHDSGDEDPRAWLDTMRCGGPLGHVFTTSQICECGAFERICERGMIARGGR